MRLLVAAVTSAVGACSPSAHPEPPGQAAAFALAAPSATTLASAAVDGSPTRPDAVPPTGPTHDAGGSNGATTSTVPGKAAPSTSPLAADNHVEPVGGADLQDRARALFEAIARDEPERAEVFWFPREPFVPLKDVKDAAKYWGQLHGAFRRDIRALHAKRASWDASRYVRFDGWSHPKWVKPGQEANKIGYFRAFHGQLCYAVGASEYAIDVHTIITWQGRWFVTHLRKFKK